MAEDRWKKLWDTLKPQIASAIQKAGETAQKAGEVISEMAKTLGKESAKLAKIGKLKADILILEGNKDNLLRKLGEKLYQLYKNEEEIKKEVFSELVKEIEELDKKILEKQKEIESIAKEENLNPEDIEKIPAVEDEEKKD
ncbi:DUF47 family protein [Dictyoglomus thermophilum]|uniref:Smc1 chromosome segregation protein, putative n=2 Tax=Dictyoglomus thermophilum TaxID=14 RepID=B5YDI8_DICT6|nr:DUF47 family protein [Dictyoglomus thermophilum]ACI19160.1 Smc1 chromosome segregation protein, putative [Dictyoglomus thermophilum H-6-12]MCX7721276.1 DUF47 family protein [Dictyoglomus thermophilum]TYT22875.1 DUF47 family protein [Dictyoglomus thermophilum]